ncbi:MAG TPA: VOC family protein [Acidimicrobiia bacterium]|nr:VOC family protein [Acidimicrobiia bacterium]
MSDPQVRVDQLNLVVHDMDATLAFYRLVGFAVDEPGAWPPGSDAQHGQVTMPDGFRLEFDNGPMTRIWHAGWRDDPNAGGGTVLGVSLPSRDAVDERYEALTAAGHVGRQAPYDAFWGARYAIVGDPDGRDVGLMSPIDPDRRYVPEV